MTYKPLKIKMLYSFEASNYVKIPAAQCATPEDPNSQGVQYKKLNMY
jgi:hypothetical protein